MQKKLLIVSYYLPPTKTVAALRIFNFHFEAKKYFSDIHCITTSNRNLFQKENYSFDDSNTSVIPTWDLRWFLLKKNDASPGLKGRDKNSFLFRYFTKIIHSFPFNILLADGGFIYILKGYSTSKKRIKEHNINYIFSSFKPFADHLICYLLKRWNPNLFWVADFRDLHVDEVRKNVFLPEFQLWFNQKILKKANIVTTVSDGLANHLKQLHSDVYVLRNGISILNQIDLSFPPYEKFTISYTGSLYEGQRNPEILFKTIQRLINEKKIDAENINIKYAGNDKELWMEWLEKYNLQNIGICHNSLPFKESLEIQKRSQVNLLLTWASQSTQGVLTAKFYEYVAAKNPILTLINGTRDQEFEKIFQAFSEGVVAYNNAESEKRIQSFILNLYDNWKNNTIVKNEISPDQLKQFYWKEMIPPFLDYIFQKNNI